MNPLVKPLVLVSLLLSVGCAGTTPAERMPDAASTLRSVLGSVRRDLEGAWPGYEVSLSTRARKALQEDRARIRGRLDAIEQRLADAEARVDPERLRGLDAEIEEVQGEVTRFRELVLQAQSGSR